MNGSLLETDTDECGIVFRMHRIVRKFVAMDSKLESGQFEGALDCSVHAVYASAYTSVDLCEST